MSESEDTGDFEKFLAQGKKLGLEDDKLTDYIFQCIDREERARQRETEIALVLQESRLRERKERR
jgi:hypothetical protein